MSDALALAAVTAVLQGLLHGAYNQPSSVLGNVAVTAVAPDIVQTTVGTGTNAPLQVNLFLHQVTHNQGWRNMGYPALGADGRTPTGSPPLALDLHYLLTTYAAADAQAEALLGYAMLALHTSPSLPRAQIRTALAALPSSYTGAFATAIAAAGVAEQVELLTITPSTLGREEMAWLWTAIKADYRPTYPFRVSVVLIQPQQPAVSALPVLERQLGVTAGLGTALPQITSVTAPDGQPAAAPGDNVTISGTNLSKIKNVTLSQNPLNFTQTLPATASTDGSSLSFQVPSAQPGSTDFPAGVYTVAALAPVPGSTAPVATNSLPLALAPTILSSWAPGTVKAGASVTLTVPCAPFLRPGQQASLLVGGQQGLLQPLTAASNKPSFIFPLLSATGGPVPVRLRVEGIDSPILDLTRTPPVFAGPMLEVVA